MALSHTVKVELNITDIPAMVDLLEPLMEATDWAIAEYTRGFGDCPEWRIAFDVAESLVEKLKRGEL